LREKLDTIKWTSILSRERRIIVARSLWVNTNGSYLPLKFLHVILENLTLLGGQSSALMSEAK
jgi:hypothetical protein